MTQTGRTADHNAQDQNWRTRSYIAGVSIGAAMGLLSAYLFNRAADESEGDEAPRISTGALLGLLLSMMALIRQITEAGKSRKKD